jgi:cell division protein FtsB
MGNNFMENIRWMILFVFILTLFLNYQIWLSEDGYQKNRFLSSQIIMQADQNRNLKVRNENLIAEITSLRERKESIEERARNDLGYIGKNEVFYFIVD